MAKDPACGTCAPRKGAFWKNKVFLITLLYVASILLGTRFSFFEPLKMNLIMYIRTIALAIAIGLLLGGVIDWLVPREYVSQLLAQKKKRTVLWAVITGFFMSACSHGILALAIQLYKKGASPPAVVSFLLASPWANLPLTIIMFSFFGLKAFAIILSAIAVAIVSGYIFMFLESRGLIEHNPNTVSVDEDFSIFADAGKRLKKVKFGPLQTMNAVKSIWAGSVSLANMVLWWIMLGMFLASAAAAYLPPNFMRQYMGATLLGLLATLLLATVLEICSEGTAPMAFEIYRQTGAFGNSFVFLMAGVVTDYTEIGLLWTNIGRRTALWLPVVAVPQVVLLGVLFNILL